MTQPVTLRKRQDPDLDIRDAIGGAEPTYSELETTMYLEPVGDRRSREDLDDRNTGMGQWLGVGRTTIEWHNWDQVVYGELTLDIVAPIRHMHNPRLNRESHVEMDLQEIQLD